jgi:hypothetical protein
VLGGGPLNLTDPAIEENSSLQKPSPPSTAIWRASTPGKQSQIESLNGLVKQAAAFRLFHHSSFPGGKTTPEAANILKVQA